MKPEAKAKTRLRHATAIACYKAWLDEFPRDKQPSLKQRVQKFDLYVDQLAPRDRKSPRRKRAKSEQHSRT